MYDASKILYQNALTADRQGVGPAGCLVRNRRAHDAADNRTAEDGETVAAVVDLNDRRRGRRRRWRRRGRNPASMMMVMGRGDAVMNGSAFRSASMMGSGHCRAAEGHTRECRDGHCLDRLVHVTPTFPGFWPLHIARRTARRFLTATFQVGIICAKEKWTHEEHSFLLCACGRVVFS